LVAVSYHGTVNVLQDVASAPGGPFDRPEWFALLADGGSEPLVVLASDGSETVALPLTETASRIEPLRNWYAFTWRQAGHCGVDLLAAAARDLRQRSHRVTLWPVPDEDGSATRLAQGFADAGWAVRTEPCDHNHVLPIDGRSFADYWAARPGQMRTTLKRKAKKVSVEIHDHFDAEAWSAYETIYNESWKPEEGDPALLRKFAKAEGAAGRIRLGIARADGEAVAAQFWTVENGTAYIHKLAHRESAKPLSAGTTLSAALFERVIDVDRVDLVDFGTGNDAYKRDWMEMDRPRYRIDCLDPKQPRAWPPLAKRLLARKPSAR
jgi:CelD/BcsL family acetyltransferase involved in cellulose biosynthesis